jgi:hypothetical protein
MMVRTHCFSYSERGSSSSVRLVHISSNVAISSGATKTSLFNMTATFSFLAHESSIALVSSNSL